MRRNKGLTIIEIVVVLLIIGVLVFILLPVISMPGRRGPEGPSSMVLIGNICIALEQYANDFGGHYPPDTIDSSQLMLDGTKIDNSSQALCYYIESEFTGDDGRKIHPYLSLRAVHKLHRSDLARTTSVAHKTENFSLDLSMNYVLDSFKNPLFYDERKSEGDKDGLNLNSFVIISGSGKDKNEKITLRNLDPGDLSMFDEDQLKNFDMLRSDYQDRIPPTSSSTNDDIINM